MVLIKSDDSLNLQNNDDLDAQKIESGVYDKKLNDNSNTATIIMLALIILVIIALIKSFFS